MQIVVLDRVAMGEDTPFTKLSSLGNVEIYDSTSESELLSRIKTADVIITNKVKITGEAIKLAKNLKLICVFATGYDNIDIKTAKENGVAVCNVPGYSTESVTLYTVATVTALLTKLLEYNSYVRTGEYSKGKYANKLSPVYHEISGKVWGIIGLGNIGKSVARVASALDAKVIANKRTPISEFECVDIDTLCRTADIITIHCPLNSETKHLINREKIALMKPSVIIVNEARGLVTDEAAIRDALIENRIGGFGADVYSSEPFGSEHPFYEIKDRQNVILTPHCAWAAYEARERCVNIICDNISAFFDGKIKNRVEI
jgi:glycerate dehydrogenase